MSSPRILLCGDVLGRLGHLFKRVSSVNKSSGPFDALLCVGQFFPDSPELLEEFMEYIEGRLPIPLPTYLIGDYGVGAAKVVMAASMKHANAGFKMDGLKICHNLFWLKGSGKFKLEGLSVAYLSGRQSESKQPGAYNQDDVDALRALAEESGIVDILLTNEWPSGVTNRTATDVIPSGASDPSGFDPTVAELAAEIKPRYHVAGTKGIFYAREPYVNAEAVHVTRFLGLAPVGNKDKQKFIHAISPTPASLMSSSEISNRPPNTTLSPYTYVGQATNAKEPGKRDSDSISDSQYWRYDVTRKRHKSGAGEGDKLCFKFLSSGSCERGEKCHFRHDMEAREQYRRGVCFDFLNKGKCERGPDCSFKHNMQEEGEGVPRRLSRSKECWFCLSSPNLESHLIISIGENYYCALAKGPLVPDHVLIIPVEHSPNSLSTPQEHETELERFQNSIELYHKKQKKEIVFFEWISIRGTHANIQAIPILSSRANALQSIFSLAAEKLGFKFRTLKDDNSANGRKTLRAEFDGKQSLFYVELPDGTVLLHKVEENETFPAQFGREVMAGLLNIADRADWRNCALSKDEETKMAEEFKTRFQEFDPNK